jgi:hypothetical protein
MQSGRCSGGSALVLPQDIGAEFWSEKVRERKQRVVKIDGYSVLRENNYGLEQVCLGGPRIYLRPGVLWAGVPHLSISRATHVAGWCVLGRFLLC